MKYFLLSAIVFVCSHAIAQDGSATDSIKYSLQESESVLDMEIAYKKDLVGDMEYSHYSLERGGSSSEIVSLRKIRYGSYLMSDTVYFKGHYLLDNIHRVFGFYPVVYFTPDLKENIPYFVEHFNTTKYSDTIRLSLNKDSIAVLEPETLAEAVLRVNKDSISSTQLQNRNNWFGLKRSQAEHPNSIPDTIEFNNIENVIVSEYSADRELISMKYVSRCGFMVDYYYDVDLRFFPFIKIEYQDYTLTISSF